MALMVLEHRRVFYGLVLMTTGTHNVEVPHISKSGLILSLTFLSPHTNKLRLLTWIKISLKCSSTLHTTHQEGPFSGSIEHLSWSLPFTKPFVALAA
jgi:hypothetical protein